MHTSNINLFIFQHFPSVFMSSRIPDDCEHDAGDVSEVDYLGVKHTGPAVLHTASPKTQHRNRFKQTCYSPRKSHKRCGNRPDIVSSCEIMDAFCEEDEDDVAKQSRKCGIKKTTSDYAVFKKQDNESTDRLSDQIQTKTNDYTNDTNESAFDLLDQALTTLREISSSTRLSDWSTVRLSGTADHVTATLSGKKILRRHHTEEKLNEPLYSCRYRYRSYDPSSDSSAAGNDNSSTNESFEDELSTNSEASGNSFDNDLTDETSAADDKSTKQIDDSSESYEYDGNDDEANSNKEDNGTICTETDQSFIDELDYVNNNQSEHYTTAQEILSVSTTDDTQSNSSSGLSQTISVKENKVKLGTKLETEEENPIAFKIGGRGKKYNVRDQTIVSIDESASSIEQSTSDSGVDSETDHTVSPSSNQTTKKDTEKFDTRISDSFDLNKYLIGDSNDKNERRPGTSEPKLTPDEIDAPLMTDGGSDSLEAEPEQVPGRRVSHPLDTLCEERHKVKRKNRLRFSDIVICGCSRSKPKNKRKLWHKK